MKSKQKVIIALIVVVLLAIAGFIIQQNFPWNSNVISFSGRLEGYETDIGAKAGGHVEQVMVREGDSVQKGQVIVVLDDSELRAQLKAAEASFSEAQQKAKQASLQLQVMQSQIAQERLAVRQAEEMAHGEMSRAQAGISSAEAKLKQLKAQFAQSQNELNLATIELKRYEKLVGKGAVPKQAYDQVLTRYNSAQSVVLARQAAVDAAMHQVDSAKGSLMQAEANSLTPVIRNSHLQMMQTQFLQAAAEAEAARMEIAKAKALWEQTLAHMAYFKLKSPLDGVVTARVTEPGAVVAPGQTLLTLLDLNSVYLRGYIPEGLIGKVRVGQLAKIMLDSSPQNPLSGYVSAIDAKASFTPENIYFRNDRIKQVFGIKVSIDNPQGFAKPGMPADGEILTHKKARVLPHAISQR